MKTSSPLLSLATAAATGLLVAGCSGPQFDIAGRYGQLDVDGEFSATTGGAPLTNTAEEMGFSEDDGYFGLRGDFKWGLPHLIVSLQNTDHSGQGTLGNDITIDGTTINGGTAVDTQFDFGVYNALLVFDILPTDTFELAAGLGVTALDVDAEFNGGGQQISTDETLPFPVLALNGGVQLSRFEVAALLSGIDGSIDGNDIRYIDLDAFARVGLFRPDDRGRVSFLIGYRFIETDIEYEDGDETILFDMDFEGPYAGLEVSF